MRVGVLFASEGRYEISSYMALCTVSRSQQRPTTKPGIARSAVGVPRACRREIGNGLFGSAIGGRI